MNIDITKLHTKVLLNALRSARANDGRNYDNDNGILESRGLPVTQESRDCNIPLASYLLGMPYLYPSDVSIADLKAELAKRPHVPNKQEAKAIRQAKAARNRRKGRCNR